MLYIHSIDMNNMKHISKTLYHVLLLILNSQYLIKTVQNTERSLINLETNLTKDMSELLRGLWILIMDCFMIAIKFII